MIRRQLTFLLSLVFLAGAWLALAAPAPPAKDAGGAPADAPAGPAADGAAESRDGAFPAVTPAPTAANTPAPTTARTPAPPAGTPKPPPKPETAASAGSGPGEAPAAAPQSPAAPDPALWPWGEPFEITTRDGVILRGMYKPRRPNRAITALFLADDKKTYVESFRLLAARLAGLGYGVAAYDTRGVGMSRTKTGGGAYNIMDHFTDPNAYKAMVKDTQDVMAWLKARNSGPIVLIGSSVGANVALLAAAEQPTDTHAVVALSPGANYHYLEPMQAAANLGGRPIFALASGKDSYSFSFISQLNKNLPNCETFSVGGAGHGHEILDFQNITKIVEWIEKN